MIVCWGCLALAAAAGNIWDGGGGNDDWGTGENWSPDGSPAPGSSNTIVFSGQNRLTPNNNYNFYDSWQQLVFSADAGSFALGGNPIDLYWKIENYSEAVQTVNLGAISLKGAVGELNPINGDLRVLSPNIYTNGVPIRIYGDSGKTVTIGGEISGSGGLSVKESSTVVLQGSNSYLGSTTAEAGVLLVNGSTGTGDVEVWSGAKLAGTGMVLGETTVNGTHSVGAVDGEVGVQQFSGDLNYGEGSIFSWDLDSNSTDSGFDQVDRMSAGGTVTMSSSAVLQIVLGSDVSFTESNFWGSDRTWAWESIFTDFATVGSFSNFSVINGADGANFGSFSVDSNGVQWSAVPEPGSLLVGTLLGVGLMRRSRLRP